MHSGIGERLSMGATSVGCREPEEGWHLGHCSAEALHQGLDQVGNAH